MEAKDLLCHGFRHSGEERRRDRIKRLGKVAEGNTIRTLIQVEKLSKPLDEIPVFGYDECVKRGYINEWKEGEKEALWAEAQENGKAGKARLGQYD